MFNCVHRLITRTICSDDIAIQHYLTEFDIMLRLKIANGVKFTFDESSKESATKN